MKKYFIIFLILISSYYSAIACSSAIISGKATPDGRPLLWKHRDAKEQENNLMYFIGNKYDFIGLVNTQDTQGTQVWSGSNSAGFSIIDTNAYNLKESEEYKEPMDQEGFFMKDALSKCATLSDFEKMLDETKDKRGVQANFGVIDAQGGAAYYEATTDSYEKFDVNDSKVAPAGYLIRTNFGFSGETAQGGGYIRYQTLEEIFLWNWLNGNLSLEFLLLDATRCLKHSLFKTDLYTTDLPYDSNQTHYVFLRDYIVQGGSVSTMVIQGVKPGEDPQLTTIWTIPSFQLTSLSVPTWVSSGNQLPKVAISENGELAPITKWSLSLKQKAFPLQTRDGMEYMNLSKILNKKGNGILQKIIPEEQKIISRTNEQIEKWRKEGFSKKEALKHYEWLDEYITDFYKNNFNIE